MSDKDKQTPVAVIGGGPGGYAAAFMAADLGLDTTLIDVEPNPGGTCLYRGCIPSKALLHVAKVLTEAREAEHWGIRFQEPDINLDVMRARTNAVVQKMTGGLGQLCKARNIRFIQGRASFLDSNRLQITADDGTEQELECEHTIVASGSRPALLEKFLIDSPRIMTSTNALLLQDVPKTLLVVGGGYIGLELGSVYAALGSKVTIVEMTGSLLPNVDTDLVEILAQRMSRLMYAIRLSSKVVGMSEHDSGIKVSIERGHGETTDEVFDRVLISIGRKANSSGLGLRTTKVEVDERGFIKVDHQRRTADAAVFAIGDVVGQPMLAHKASHEGRVAAQVIAGRNVAFEPRAIPAVVFTDPEVAWCGLTETDAKKEGRAVKIAKFPWGASGRAATLDRVDGMTKIVADADTDQVLGVGIVGVAAGELIGEGVLAVEMGALASDVELTIHAHPTLGETIMESAEIIFGHSTHFYRPQKP